MRPSDPLLVIVAVLLVGCSDAGERAGPDVVVWHTITFDFEGPQADEGDDDPNPFLDYRLQVTFTGPGGQVYDVPGFFDGGPWRVRFTPDEEGVWRAEVSFRRGENVAIDADPSAGEPLAPDGEVREFLAAPVDEQAPGFHKWGRLEYVGGHYLKFRDGPYWLKGGTNSPENLLGYTGFDGTPEAGHGYAAHVADWVEGDPDWGDGAGRGIIGALNYLASRHVNSVYFMPMNIGGDAQDTWPFLGPVDAAGSEDNDNLHYDTSKLSQWEAVFAHAERQGIFLHFVFDEAEEPNKRELDDAALGVERKLFYREMAARFSHHNALQWNLCEEYDFPTFPLDPGTIQEWAGYLQEVDPYDHPITVHQLLPPAQSWAPFLGDGRFSVTSFQNRDPSTVEAFRELSAGAGRPLPIGMDEFYPDVGSPGNTDEHRKKYTWPIFLSGGTLEFILDELLSTEDFRRHERRWDQLWYARSFMEENLPFWEMQPADELLSGEDESAGPGQVFAKPGEVYAVYLPSAGLGGELDLSADGASFTLRWYNPRTGDFQGSAGDLQGGAPVDLGLPPGEQAQDWVALIEAAGR